MTTPVVQRLFTTPVIEAVLASPEPSAIAEAARSLAARYTTDVTQPARPRFTWEVGIREIVLAPGEIQPLTTAPGAFWVAMCRIDASGGAGEVALEDPRAATTRAGLAGLDVSCDPGIERLQVPPAGLVMFQAFLRHGLVNSTTAPQRWAVVDLGVRRTGP